YHTSKAMQTFCETHADRLTIEQLPAYSPDFNLRGQNLYASRVSHLQRVGLNILTTRGFPPVVFHKNIFPQGFRFLSLLSLESPVLEIVLHNSLRDSGCL